MERAFEYTQNPAMVKSVSGISPEAIGERIKLIRAAMGMNAADFARQVGLSSQTLANYETGYRRPELDKAMLIVQKTGATLDYIYLGDSSGLPMRLANKMPAEDLARKLG